MAPLARDSHTWLLIAAAILLVPGVGWAAAAEPVAVVTELRPGAGEIRIRRAGESGWSAAQPLLALRPGDEVRVSGDGRVVVALAGGGVETVSAANSPFVAHVPRGQSGTDTVRALLSGVVQFLLGQQRDVHYEALSVRTGPVIPRILSPRETRLLPGPVVFEWAGPPSLRYRVRVLGPPGPLWEAGDLPLRPVEYPSSAPPFRPGSRYTWVLEAPGQLAQQAHFELVTEPEASRLRAALADLGPGALAGYPPNTTVLMRAAFLLREGLYEDVRRELIGGISRDPAESTLHVLLGQVYERIGLPDLAAGAFEQASALSGPKP